MLERAERNLAHEHADTRRRVRLVKASGEDASEELGDDGVFGGVLCHGVLMYLDDPEPLVDVLCRLIEPDGWCPSPPRTSR